MGQKHWAIVCALILTATTAGYLVAQQPVDDPFGYAPADQPPPAATQEPPRPGRSASSYAPGEAERRIEAALDQPLREPLKFVEQPLRDVTTILSETYDIPIQFDTAALDAVAASPDVEVSISIANVSLRSALDLMLRNAGAEELTYIIDKQVLLITTQEEAETRLEVKVYRVDDLIVPHPTYTPWDYDADYDSLIDMIVAAIEYESWMQNGSGEGEIQPFPPGMIVVTQTHRVHEQIAALLAQLRDAKAAIDRDHQQQMEETRDKPVTRGFPIHGQDGLTAPENRPALIEAIKTSVDWRAVEGEVLEDEFFVIVLPNRIVVRHMPPVVRQAQLVIHEIAHSREMPPGMGGGGDMGGRGRGGHRGGGGGGGYGGGGMF